MYRIICFFCVFSFQKSVVYVTFPLLVKLMSLKLCVVCNILSREGPSLLFSFIVISQTNLFMHSIHVHGEAFLQAVYSVLSIARTDYRINNNMSQNCVNYLCRALTYIIQIYCLKILLSFRKRILSCKSELRHPILYQIALTGVPGSV